MAKRLRTLSGVRGFGHIEVYAEGGGKRTPRAAIDDRPGEVHIVSHDEGRNLVTKGCEAYGWEAGAEEGLITKFGDGDLVEYPIFPTDPSAIMTCLPRDALYEPGESLPPRRVGSRLVWKLPRRRAMHHGPIEGLSNSKRSVRGIPRDFPAVRERVCCLAGERPTFTEDPTGSRGL